MAKDSHKSFYSVGDIVTIYRRNWRITAIYPREYRYRVVLLDPKPDDIWTELYPDHNEITGKVDNWESRQIKLEEI